MRRAECGLADDIRQGDGIAARGTQQFRATDILPGLEMAGSSGGIVERVKPRDHLETRCAIRVEIQCECFSLDAARQRIACMLMALTAPQDTGLERPDPLGGQEGHKGFMRMQRIELIDRLGKCPARVWRQGALMRPGPFPRDGRRGSFAAGFTVEACGWIIGLRYPGPTERCQEITVIGMAAHPDHIGHSPSIGPDPSGHVPRHIRDDLLQRRIIREGSGVDAGGIACPERREHRPLRVSRVAAQVQHLVHLGAECRRQGRNPAWRSDTLRVHRLGRTARPDRLREPRRDRARRVPGPKAFGFFDIGVDGSG